MMDEIYKNILDNDNFETNIQFIDAKVKAPNTKQCYISLLNALMHKTEEAEMCLVEINQAICTPQEKSILLEARMLLEYYSKNDSRVIELAQESLSMNQEAFISTILLAKLAEYNKNYPEAIDKYRLALNIHPGHNGTLLDITRAISMGKGNRKEAVNFIDRAKPSYRKSLYKAFAVGGLGSTIGTVIIVSIFGLLWLSGLRLVVFIGILSFSIILEIVTQLKIKWDKFIMGNIIGYQFVVIIEFIAVTLLSGIKK